MCVYKYTILSISYLKMLILVYSIFMFALFSAHDPCSPSGFLSDWFGLIFFKLNVSF